MLFSIKSRLIASHLAVAIIAAVAASVYLYLSFGKLQIEYHEHNLLSSAYALADALETDFGTPHGNEQAQHTLQKLASKSSGEYAIIDAKGRILAATSASIPLGKQLSGIDKALKGKPYTQVTQGAKADDEHIIASVPIENNGKVVGVVRAWILEKNYRASLIPIKRVTILALCGVIALSVIISLVLAQALIIPIKKMRQLSRRIAKGDFSIRLNATISDELGELTADLNTMASKLQDLENIRRDFVGNVSHELRSPVSNIRITSEVLERRAERLGDDSAKLFETITAETQRLESMIDELMELSVIESDALVLDKEVFEVKPMLEEILETILPRVNKKDLKIRLLAEPDITLVADRTRLARAISNLLDNAVKFTPEGGKIVISARICDGETIIEVTDSGEGIALTDLPRVFERFYRADKARRRKGGTGIGLAIVKHTAEAHGGTAEVCSKEGHGSTFRIRLPSH